MRIINDFVYDALKNILKIEGVKRFLYNNLK